MVTLKGFINSILTATTGYSLQKANRKSAHRVLFESLFFKSLGITEVWDVGANSGQFYESIESCFPSETIFRLFEPIPRLSELLRSRFEQRDNLTIEPIALSDVDGIFSFFLSEFSPTSSLLEPRPEQEISFPGSVDSLSEIQVPTKRIDTYLKEKKVEIAGSALLKLDVQGAELNVLKGAGNELERFKAIYCECALVSCYSGQPLFQEVASFLQNRRFRVAGFGEVLEGADATFTQVDVLFVRELDPSITHENDASITL